MRKILMFVLLCTSLFATKVFAQTKTVTGRVTDDLGSPLVGATVSAVGGKGNATTNAAGEFSLTLSSKIQEVEVSFVGFANQRLTVTGQTTLDAKLSRNTSSLSEVVVTGYQTLRRSEVTGSVAKVAGSELAQKPIGSFTQLLQGKATGLQATGQSGR
ncbi:MAG TPA: carboxypeptidase-like regulatory domain-containing protein, partial [Segetibacter sp.]|nr:carboxypeptidase-like regulatory domain-containing protein [Segetibacter sp.]